MVNNHGMRLVASIVATSMLGVSACGASGTQPSQLQPDIDVGIRGHHLSVHIAAGSKSAPLLIYATGDGGWPGDERLFDRMMPLGFPMAGFSSVDYVGLIDTPDKILTAATVASDLQNVIDAALAALGLPKDHPTVLVGFSRGAGLAVAAATQPSFRTKLRGILAIALTTEEEYVVAPDGGRVFRPGADHTLQTYANLPRLGSLKFALIQSTRDEFIPAEEARQRFGPDTETRRFRPIDARDHSFGGRLNELAAEMKLCIEWIVR